MPGPALALQGIEGDMSGRLPALFVSHGSPMVAIEDEDWGRRLRQFGASLPRPDAVVVVSAHFEAPAPVRITASRAPETIHDFSGFPPALNRIQYVARGDPDLASRVRNLLGRAGIAATLDPRRGLDHGAWVPLRFLFPRADVPVIEVSLPVPRTPRDALKIGGALAPLRGGGVLLLGSGGIVHNLGRMDASDDPARVATWARAFDTWMASRLESMDVAAITNYREAAPSADSAAPTSDHFDPIFVVLGSASPGERVQTLHEGFRYGSLSMRSFAVA
jgi:4,5-DOPA dioxygenase extradiol